MAFKDFAQSLFSSGGGFGGRAMGSPYFPSKKSPVSTGKSIPPQAGKTNIIKTSNGNSDMLPIINNEYSKFKDIVTIIEDYEYYYLTEKILELVKDYIIRIVDYNAPIITPRSGDQLDEKSKAAYERINQVLEEINFRSLLIENIDKINYYGSISYAVSAAKDEELGVNKYKLSKLKSAHDVVVVTKDDLKFYIVNKKAEKATNMTSVDHNTESNLEVLTDDKIMYLGAGDMNLKHDKASLSVIAAKLTKKEEGKANVQKYGIDEYLKSEVDKKIQQKGEIGHDSVEQPEAQEVNSAAFDLSNPIQAEVFKGITASEYNITCSKPLYYSVHPKVKEYLTKDIILNVLGVKSSIQPSFMTLGIDAQYGYSITEIMDLISTLEGRLNTSIDIDILNSANMKMDTLVNRIMGNLRIIPDLGHNIRSIDSKDIDDIIRRIDELSRRKVEVKEEILESVGLPRDLYEGASNREEVLKRDERFQSMVLKMINRLRSSVKSAVTTISKLEGIELSDKDYYVTMFKKSSIEYHFNTTKLDSIRDMTNMLLVVMTDVQQLLQMESIKPENLIAFIKTQMSVVGEDVADLLPSMEELMQLSQKQK